VRIGFWDNSETEKLHIANRQPNHIVIAAFFGRDVRQRAGSRHEALSIDGYAGIIVLVGLESDTQYRRGQGLS
jgi:hypothetical protein